MMSLRHHHCSPRSTAAQFPSSSNNGNRYDRSDVAAENCRQLASVPSSASSSAAVQTSPTTPPTAAGVGGYGVGGEFVYNGSGDAVQASSPAIRRRTSALARGEMALAAARRAVFPSSTVFATPTANRRRSGGGGGGTNHRVERSRSQVSAIASRSGGGIRRPPPPPPLVVGNGHRRQQHPRRSCDTLLKHADADRELAGGEHSPQQLTLVLMGAPMVGKSTLVNQFLWEIFVRDYRPTVEEFNWIEYSSTGDDVVEEGAVSNAKANSSEGGAAAVVTVLPPQNIRLQIIDSAGSRDFLAMRYLYYKIGDAFMIVYALNDSSSYAEAMLILKEVLEKNTKNAPILLVANKSDLMMAPSASTTIGGGDEKIVKQGTSVHDNNNNKKADDAVVVKLPPSSEMRNENGTVGVETLRICAKNLEEVKHAFWTLIRELAYRRCMLAGGDCAVGEHAKLSTQSSSASSSAAALISRTQTPTAADAAANSSKQQHHLRLQKRRQSMPSMRTANELGIDKEALERLLRQHEAATAGSGAFAHSKQSCTIS